MTDKLTYVRMYADHSRIGSGVRGFLVLKRGRLWARLLYPPTLTGFKVHVRALDKATELSVPKGLAARLRHIAKDRERLALPWSVKDTETALDMLRTTRG